jgi:hypothetical protein
MRVFIIVLVFGFSNCLQAKEWKNLKQYQISTQKEQLSSSDWLASDRKQNTLVWQYANIYNLNNNNPQEYQSIIQRRDFYYWIKTNIKAKGHEVIWQEMAYYISLKLRLLNTVPYCVFISKNVKNYARQANEVIFNNAFERLKMLYFSEEILKKEAAEQWDKMMLLDEQHIWVESIYRVLDQKSIKQIDRIVKRKFLYALVIPKAMRFDGDISSPEERYNYALNTFKPYFKNHHQ